MEKQFEIIRKTRAFFSGLLNELTLDQLNAVPQGFNNNIAWNMGHVIAAQQSICYRRSNLSMVVSEEFFNKYKPDSKPTGPVDGAAIEKIKDLLFTTIDQLEADYKMHKFGAYMPWQTRYGVEVSSIEDAIAFLPFHEGLHTGYCMALRRSVNR